jgi:uncharacterized membrane protein SirB2
MASQKGSICLPRHIRLDESLICIKLTFRARGMNWIMSKKVMNTESMSTIPPLIETMIITNYCQLMKETHAVATQAYKTRKGLAQILSR